MKENWNNESVIYEENNDEEMIIANVWNINESINKRYLLVISKKCVCVSIY